MHNAVFQVHSKVNQPYTYSYPSFFRFFSHIGYYRILSRVPCAIRQVLISYLFYFLATAARHVGSQFPNQGLNPGHSSESTKP